MAMGALMGSQSLATTSRPQIGAVHSSGQSTWQRGSTSLGSVNVQPSSRCVPVVKAIKSPSQTVGVAPVAERVAEPARDRVANEVVPSDLEPRWRAIRGEYDWEGLLDPLDPTLREEILRYGEFAQAAYDNFELEDHSKYCGSARFNKDKMFSMVGLNETGYEVQRYFYATANVVKNVKWPAVEHVMREATKVFRIFKKSDSEVVKNSSETPPSEVVKKSDSEVVEKPYSEFFKRPPLKLENESWSMDSNWMGYIAVSTDEEKIKQLGRRDIMIAWRGTVRNSEWVANYEHNFSPASLDKGPSIKVETGFLTLYTSKNPLKTKYNKTSARTQVLTELKRLLELYKDEKLSITICGHSLGSALATLNAHEIAWLGLNIPGKHAEIPEDWLGHTAPPAIDHEKLKLYIPITVFSFGGPRVGNEAFRDSLKDLGVKVLRIVNVHDKVPHAPSCIQDKVLGFFGVTENLMAKIPFTYTHVGTKLELDSSLSEYLEQGRADRTTCHNMEQYLHLVDGHKGDGKDFKLTTGRHLALVNKGSNFLKDTYFIPESWWQRENKGLVWMEDGSWKEVEREEEDIPTAESVKFN